MSYITSKLRNACILTLVAGQALAETAMNATRSETTPLEKNLVVGFSGFLLVAGCAVAGLVGVGIYNKCRYGYFWNSHVPFVKIIPTESDRDRPVSEKKDNPKKAGEKVALSSSDQTKYHALDSVKLDDLNVRQQSR